MVCYKACKKYMELLKNNNGQDVPVNVPVNFIKRLSKTEEKVIMKHNVSNGLIEK